MDRYELVDAAREVCAGMNAETCRVSLIKDLGQQAVDRLGNIYFPFPHNTAGLARRVVMDATESSVVQAVAPPNVNLVIRLASEFVK